MIKLFGTPPQYVRCIEKKKEYEEKGIEFIYYDLSNIKSREAIAQAVYIMENYPKILDYNYLL